MNTEEAALSAQCEFSVFLDHIEALKNEIGGSERIVEEVGKGWKKVYYDKSEGNVEICE